MAIFDRLRALFGGGEPAVFDSPTISKAPPGQEDPRGTATQAVLADIFTEAAAAATPGDWRLKLSASPRWQALRDDPPALQRAVLIAVVAKLRDGRGRTGEDWRLYEVKRQIAQQLLKRRLDLPLDWLKAQLERHHKYATVSLQYDAIAPMALLQASAYAFEQPAAARELAPVLTRLRAKLLSPTRHRPPTKFEQGYVDRIAAILDPAAAAAAPAIPPGAFGAYLTAELAKLPAVQQAAWEALAAHSVKAGDKAAPAKKWRTDAQPLLQAVGSGAFGAALTGWLAATTPDPQQPDTSLDVLKGFLWLAPDAAAEGLAGAVGRFAETCFRKVGGVGARSVKLGNAALYALSEMADDPLAGAELFRLRGVIKYPSAQAVLDKRISELASSSGRSIAALEDSALPDFGLAADGSLERSFGPAAVRLAVQATVVDMRWTGAGAKPLKSAPAAIKRDSKAEWTAFALLAKDIEKVRAGQVKRLEDSWLEARCWDFPAWRQHYLEHPLRRAIVQSLIWQVSDRGRTLAVLPGEAGLEDVAGAPVEISAGAVVRLWHPLDADPADVLLWRARIMTLGLTQPIKQAHREIYVVTDAELATATYSNRFAAHILRQHQFRALCQSRGWRYDFMGGWDSWNVPTRAVPARDLLVEYSVEAIDDGQRSEAYVPLHIATDQVRFVRAADRQPMPLIDVDRIVFSELMRDVDLFVAVTSVAADPGWHDGGPEGRFGGYWVDWAFGELGQSAQTRKELIAAIAPRLSIADRLEIGDKALIVTGKRHKYAIHFGSANIQILPQNRYLCIVPDRSPAEADAIRLPFTGDGQLSTILAKAFMLADESRIEDPTILRQL